MIKKNSLLKTCTGIYVRIVEMDEEEWFELPDEELEYPFLPACDNIWTE